MKLTDIMSAAHLSTYAEIAMVIFMVVFVGAAIRIATTRKEFTDHMGHLPLDD
jgi:hypothetical protein